MANEPLDYTKITNIEFEGIDYRDAPDFADAYISNADYNGEEMTDAQLEELNSDSGFVYDMLIEYIY